ncbi:copper-binding protein [Roseateles sp. SL47]|uniref:copper-binding protein n=1 Tax=Roseateles sp. SL47 TaxID=2995138 RepID=UPI00226DD71F|nr:copper-binding protein [Roseateles sp. SL47]WAC73321.1 copper-binding protein [Roseateles sp. SL47]
MTSTSNSSHQRPIAAALLTLAAALAGMASASPAMAQSRAAPAADSAAMPPATAPAQTWVAGEVRRVDIALNRLTVRHADIPYLDMGAMTMVFRLQPGALSADQVKALKAGDRIEFQAEAPLGQLTITALRRVTGKAAGGSASAASSSTAAPTTAASAPASEHHHH